MIKDLETEREEEIKKTYSKVVKKFSGIKKNEIKLVYLDSLDDYAIMSPYYGTSLLHYYRPTLYVGGLIFELEKKEREAIIAHELWHYKRLKCYSLEKFEREIVWSKEIGSYTSKMLTKKKHRADRLAKWHFLCESYADKEAARLGYKKQIISSLKKICKDNPNMPPLAKQVNNMRIKKLEEKVLKL